MKPDDISIACELFVSCPDLDQEPQTIDDMFRDTVSILNLGNVILTPTKETYGYCFWAIGTNKQQCNTYLFDDFVYDLFFYFLMNDE